MEKKISSKQLTYAVAGHIMATSQLSKHLYIYTKNEAWIPILLGYLFVLLFSIMYSVLVKRYPNLSLIEINEAVFGKIIGSVFSALHVFNFFVLACLNVNVFAHFVMSMLLPTTPIFFIVVMLVLICAWAVRKGPSNFTSYGTIIVFFSFSLILANTLMLSGDMQFRNLLPIFNLPPIDYAVGSHFIAFIPLSEIVIFMMFVPHLIKPQDFGKSVRKGLTVGACFWLIIIIRDIVVLGGGTQQLAFPTFTVIRLIDVADILTRLEIVYATILISLMFFKVSILYFAAVSGFQRLMKFQSYKFLIIIFGSLITVYSVSIFTAQEHFLWLSSGAAPFYSTFFLALLPFVTFLTAAFRGFLNKSEMQKAQTI